MGQTVRSSHTQQSGHYNSVLNGLDYHTQAGQATKCVWESEVV